MVTIGQLSRLDAKLDALLAATRMVVLLRSGPQLGAGFLY
jgi:hypothetical protein